jgi:hypothetical protein
MRATPGARMIGRMGYDVRGRLAETCTCHTFCPCVAGLEPDGGTCEFSWVFQFDEGQIDDVDVSGLRMGALGHLDGAPGARPGAVRVAMFVDDRATEDQEKALLEVFTGKAGGPFAEIAGLIGEVIAVERVPLAFDIEQGVGTFAIGGVARGEIEVLRSPDGTPTSIHNFALSPLGGMAYTATPTSFELHAAQHGFEFRPNTATQFEFHHVV